MRLIGYLEDEGGARIFGDFLYARGIENRIEFSKGEGWAVWVAEEEKLAEAAGLLTDFRKNPADPGFQSEAQNAERLRAQKASEQEAWRRRLKNRRHLFRPLTGYGFGPLTYVLMAISVGVFLVCRFGYDLEKIQSLFITQFIVSGQFVQHYPHLPEIAHGEVWRLFTPMFIHFNPLHIIFNMLWLRDLGSMIEGRQSSSYLAVLTLAIAGVSNVAQFYLSLHHSPSFGGMSGVVYGLLGYIWIRGKRDPASGLYLNSYTVVSSLIWLVLCFTGALGNIANTAHIVGLLLGMGWGYLSSLRYR